MEEFLFPDWMLFAGFFLFLKVYEPTKLYLNNTCCLAISIVCAMFLEHQNIIGTLDIFWLVAVVMFALLMSVPFMLGGMIGAIIQQLLLLNEQSVQDKRFTDETESLAKISQLIFLYYSLKEGVIFHPFFQLFNISNSLNLKKQFADIFCLIMDSIYMLVVVSGKYIIIMIIITLCCGYVDHFFKKASLSQFVMSNIKAVVVVVLLNLWFLGDQFYVFQKLMEKVGYE